MRTHSSDDVLSESRLAIPSTGTDTRLFRSAVRYQRLRDVECFYQSLPCSIVDREDGLAPLHFHILFASFIGTTFFGSYECLVLRQ